MNYAFTLRVLPWYSSFPSKNLRISSEGPNLRFFPRANEKPSSSLPDTTDDLIILFPFLEDIIGVPLYGFEFTICFEKSLYGNRFMEKSLYLKSLYGFEFTICFENSIKIHYLFWDFNKNSLSIREYTMSSLWIYYLFYVFTTFFANQQWTLFVNSL